MSLFLFVFFIVFVDIFVDVVFFLVSLDIYVVVVFLGSTGKLWKIKEGVKVLVKLYSKCFLYRTLKNGFLWEVEVSDVSNPIPF